jgi:hypothetical protein
MVFISSKPVMNGGRIKGENLIRKPPVVGNHSQSAASVAAGEILT